MEPRPDTSTRPSTAASTGGSTAPRGYAPASPPLPSFDEGSNAGAPTAGEGDGGWRQRGPSVPRAGQTSEPPGSMLGNDHPYSPGPALSPLDGSRSGRWVGPLLALVALAVVIGAVVFAFNRARNGDDQRNGTIANQNATGTVIAAGAAGAATKSGDANPTADPTKGAAQTSGANPTAANPAQTPDAPAPTTTDAANANASANPIETAASADTNRTRSLLPAVSALPKGFVRTEDDKRTKDQVAAAFADPAGATTQLDAWGWKENRFRTFEIPAESTDPAKTTFVNVSVHRFADKQGATEALTYFADAVVQAQSLEEITVDQIGDQTRALKGAPDGTNLVVIYIRDGNYLIRIGGSSPQGDPTADVVAIAKKVVG